MNWIRRAIHGKKKVDRSLRFRCPSDLAPGMTRTGLTNFILSFSELASKDPGPCTSPSVPKRIWQCWWQGQEQAPDLVKTCLASVRTHFPDHEIVVITRDNYSQYIQVPETILRRFNKGGMSHAHLSDYMRTALLARYGGIWIDATVFISEQVPQDITESEFFVFSSPFWMSQMPDLPSPNLLGPLRFFASRPSLTLAASIWWITSAPGSATVRVLRDLQEELWRRHDRPTDYLQTYELLSLAFACNSRCRQDWLKMPKRATVTAQLLQELLPEPFDQGSLRYGNVAFDRPQANPQDSKRTFGEGILLPSSSLSSAMTSKHALYGASNYLQYRFNRLRNNLAERLPFPRIVRARLRRRTFAHILPIGVNCETAFRFYRKWRFLDSSLFAWANSRNLDTLTTTLSDLSRLMTGGSRFSDHSRMWICQNTNIGFHGKLDLAAEAVPTPEQIAADLADLRGRITHLKDKFLRALADDKTTLLVHRLAADDMRAPDLSVRLDRLQRTLEGLGANNYTLLVICEKPFLAAMPTAPNRIFRSVNLFNALDHAADKNVGDAVGWQAIFTEFAPEKILPKAHKFKFE